MSIGDPISPQEAFDPNRPLPKSAVRALEYLDAKDAPIAGYRTEVERLQRHIDLAFRAACSGDAHAARKHLTDARWGTS